MFINAEKTASFIIKYLLTISLFYSPINVLLRFVLKSVIASMFLEINIVLCLFVLIATIAVAGPVKRGAAARIVSLDIFMFFWLLYVIVPFLIMSRYSSDVMLNFGVLREMFIVPIVYFLVRLCIMIKNDYDDVFEYVFLLFKVATVWMFVEFILVNFLGMRGAIEGFVLSVLPAFGIYETLSLFWTKPAGPIFGIQNSSILALIIVNAFYVKYRFSSVQRYRWWLIVSLFVFFTTITITALLLFILMMLLFEYRARKSRVTKYAAMALALVAASLVFVYREDIVSLRVHGSAGTMIYYYYEDMLFTALRNFSNGLVEHPFGVGWLIETREATSLMNFADHYFAPPEIFIFRMAYYVGSVFFAFFIAIHVYVYAVYRGLKKIVGMDINLFLSMGTIFIILGSTIHYESYTEAGFSYLYAFLLAMLPVLSSKIRGDSVTVIACEAT